jgi:hypothetical protein
VAEVERSKDIKLEELKMLSTVGMGTFGRVRLCEHRATGRGLHSFTLELNLSNYRTCS